MSSHRSSAFAADKKLRYLKIEFVSAGTLEGTLKKQDTIESHAELPPTPPELSSEPNTAAALAKMALSSPSPPESEPDSSSEDEIVFQGRSSIFVQPPPAKTPKPQKAAPMKETPVPPPAPPEPQHATATLTEPSVATKNPKAEKQPVAEDLDEGAELDGSIVQEGFRKRLNGQSPWSVGTLPWESRSKPGIGWMPVKDRGDMDQFVDDALDAKEQAEDDYMQNIRDEILGMNNSAFRSSFAHRPLDIDAEDSGDFNAPESDEEEDEEAEGVFDAAESAMFDALMDELADGGISDSDMSDIFIADDGSEEDDEDEDDDDDEESDEAEEDVNAAMDDERLARVLQRQEELGLGSDEIVLFGGDDYFDDDIPAAFTQTSRSRPKRGGRGGGRSGRKEPSFPSASAMADALDLDPYGGFDVMDTERPSLRSVKKGRKGIKPPELSDSDLNEQLHATWERDRTKKRLKKAEREELRKQGLLGRKGKAPDLAVKYSEEITMDELVEEIRDFMFSDMQTLSLPPMESHRRAVVHRMVHQLNVTSKSRGSSANRFTVLSKTKRTLTVEDSFFDALKTKRGFRAQFASVSSRRGATATGGKRVVHTGVSYRDGEVVGAKAKELGPENKGRVLLEKMGWSKGMALGAESNKGILLPIAHTIKMGKGGLG